jgi:hypothetical protein
MKLSIALASTLLGLKQTIASLPRCPNTEPSGGNDMWQVSPFGTYCATLLYSADFRVIQGDLLTYGVEVKDDATCEASYKWTLNKFTTMSLGTCKSYYIMPGVACLSSCADLFDCYVSEDEQVLDVSCASAAGVPEIDSSTDEEETVCYKYNYSKGPFSEDPPEETKCDSPCVSYESVTGDVTISIGRCTSGISNFCETMKDGDTTKCVECVGKLCNPVYSYNGSSVARASFVGIGLAVGAAVFSL